MQPTGCWEPITTSVKSVYSKLNTSFVRLSTCYSMKINNDIDVYPEFADECNGLYNALRAYKPQNDKYQPIIDHMIPILRRFMSLDVNSKINRL